MPELHIPDWIIQAQARLEREHGHARVLIGVETRAVALALNVPRGVVLLEVGRKPHDRIVGIDSATGVEQSYAARPPQ